MLRRTSLALVCALCFATPALAASDINSVKWATYSAAQKLAYTQALSDGMFVELYAQMSLDGNAASAPHSESARMRAYLAGHPQELANELDKLVAADRYKDKTEPMRQYVLRAYFALQPEAEKRYKANAKGNAKKVEEQVRPKPTGTP